MYSWFVVGIVLLFLCIVAIVCYTIWCDEPWLHIAIASGLVAVFLLLLSFARKFDSQSQMLHIQQSIESIRDSDFEVILKQYQLLEYRDKLNKIQSSKLVYKHWSYYFDISDELIQELMDKCEYV